MKAARNKIAEQAKQRDCSRRMETSLIRINANQMDLILGLQTIQFNSGLKPASKLHDVILVNSDTKKAFLVMYELHEIMQDNLDHLNFNGSMNFKGNPTLDKEVVTVMENLSEVSDQERMEGVIDDDK